MIRWTLRRDVCYTRQLECWRHIDNRLQTIRIHQCDRKTRHITRFYASPRFVHCTLCLKKVPTFKLSVTLSNLNRFKKIRTPRKRMTCGTKSYDTTHLTLGMLLHYVGKLKIKIFCWYRTMQTNCIFIASNFVTHPQILIFLVLNSKFSTYWLQIKFIVSLFFYLFTFCDQFVAPEIRHSRRRCSVCQQSAWYLATTTRCG